MTEQNKDESNRKKGSRVDWYSLWVLWLSTLAVSGVISLYVMSIAWFNLKEIDSDPLDIAAQSTASTLGGLTVSDTSFGHLGLSRQANVRTFNTAVSLVRNGLTLADAYQLPTMKIEARKDYFTLLAKQNELAKKLNAAVEKDKGWLYRDTVNLVTSRLKPTETLKDLNITLGTVKGKFLSTDIPARKDERNLPYVKEGKFICQTAVDIPLHENAQPLQNYYFQQEPPYIQPLGFADFEPLAQQSINLPSALLIDAEVEIKSNKQRRVTTLRRRVCVTIGSKESAVGDRNSFSLSRPNCLAISFPHGKIERFKCAADLLRSKDWLSNGDWTECQGGTIPGGGTLKPTVNPVVRQMSSGDTFSVLLYHFIRGQTAPVSSDLIRICLETAFEQVRPSDLAESNSKQQGGKLYLQALSEINEEGKLELLDLDESRNAAANTALLQNTEARSFAYLYQMGAKEKGQAAIGACFTQTGQERKFPDSALPLIVDKSGACNLPGHKSFDRDLAGQLLRSIYETNLAANDTLAVAEIMQKSSTRNLKEARDRCYLLSSELAYLKQKLAQMGEAGVKNSKGNINEEISLRQSKLEYEESQQKILLQVSRLSTIARANAISVASASYECGAHLFKIAAQGVHKLDERTNAFVLGKHFIFLPQTQALGESELLEQAETLSADAARSKGSTGMPVSPWLSNRLRVFGSAKNLLQKADTQISVEGRALSEWQAQEDPARALPCTVVIDSRAFAPIKTKGKSFIMPNLVFANDPFTGPAMSLQEGQLVYYNQNALQSGKEKEVLWSTIARDNKARYAVDANPKTNFSNQANLFSSPSNPSWCKQAINFSRVLEDLQGEHEIECPGLAGEWQLRAPIVPAERSMQTLIEGATLTDPRTGQRVPQIPPVGIELI